MSTAQEQFAAREKRFNDAVNLKNKGRIPVSFAYGQYFATEIAGISKKEAMFDFDKLTKAWKDFNIRYDLDMATFPALFPAKGHEILGIKSMKWPGGALRDHEAFQYLESDYLKEGEYDAYLNDPDGFVMKNIWPRISSLMAPLADLELSPLSFLDNAFSLPLILGSTVSNPVILNLLEKLVKLGQTMGAYENAVKGYQEEMTVLGYPIVSLAEGICAFDWVSTMLRGMEGSMLDMFSQSDKLLKTIASLTPATIMAGVIGCEMTNLSRFGLPLFRGSKGFMSDEQFQKFYWPSLKELICGLVDSGITPVVVFEGDYTPRLEYLRELPKGKVAAHFEHIDRKKFKQVLGDHMCFWGNVSSSSLIFGTKEQIQDEVKELIDVLGDTGGLIIDGAHGIPDEAKPENIATMVETVRMYT